MSITSGERHDLHTRLAEILGEDHANTLMEHLPPVGWADVATKRDLDNVEVALSGDIANLGTQLRSELAAQGSELRGEIATLGTELRREIATLGTKIDVESISRKSDMDRLMSSVLREQRIFLTAIFLAISALAALGTIFG